jgi:ABC-type multidrug transport system fused ATPase/permease subunit
MPRAVPVNPRDAKGRLDMRQRLSLLIGDRRHLVIWLGACSLISAVLEGVFLALIAQIALNVVGAKKASGHGTHLGFLNIHAGVETLILLALILALGRLVMQVPLSLLPARIAADVQARLRRDLFAAYTKASWGVQSREREGYLQETMTGQVMQATSGAVQATSLITALVTFMILLIYAVLLNPVAAGTVLGATVVLFVALRPLNNLGARRARALSQAQLEYAGGVNQANRLAEETHVFGVAEAQKSEVNRLIEQARELFYRTQVMGRITPGIFQSMILLFVVGALQLLERQGAGHVASLSAVIIILLRAGNSGQSVQGSWQSLRQALPFIERLQDTRQRYLASVHRDGTLPLEHIGSLAFEDVSFGYTEGRPVLSEINFEVAAGESVGVIGPSGAGKSTLIQLLLRLRLPDSGSYLVDGRPAQDYIAADWHRRVAYVPQEPRLLHASVAENIRYFRDVDDEAVERAARLARIHDDVVAWPDGYDTIVGPRADAVSGGQQQRICLARALVARPEVLVLDEPTSALDPHSESLIQESLMALREELTLFVIAHRMSTLDICDRVMVIIDGRLAAFDTIEELKSDNAYYRSASALAAGAGGRLL